MTKLMHKAKAGMFDRKGNFNFIVPGVQSEGA